MRSVLGSAKKGVAVERAAMEWSGKWVVRGILGARDPGLVEIGYKLITG